MIIAAVLFLGCAQTTVNTAATIWINPLVKSKLGEAPESQLRTELQQCAATAINLPKSCKTNGKTLTFAKRPPTANCHWTCGSMCSKGEDCAWEVKAGVWTLEYRRQAAIEREQRRACTQDWENTFNDPEQYEQQTCEVECIQLSAITSLSKVDAPCAMEVFGIVARRPRCIGPVPEGCKREDSSLAQNPFVVPEFQP
jgi:hypothetical protein